MTQEVTLNPVSMFFRGFFRHIPGWFIVYVGINSLFAAVSNFNPPHHDWAWTYLFPEALAMLYFAGWVRSSSEVKNKTLYLGLILALQVFSFILIYFFAEVSSFAQDVAAWTEASKAINFPPAAGETITYYQGRETIIWGHEISSLIWTILIFSHVLYYKRIGGVLFFYGAALLYGMTLESNGVMMKFFFEDQYNLYLPPFHAPAVTMFGWATVFYPCSMVLHSVQKGFPKLQSIHWLWGGLLISIFGLMIDIQVDPVATNLTLWTWNSLLQQNGFHFLGVPMLNFNSWLFAVWVFGSFYLYLTQAANRQYHFALSREQIIERDRRLKSEHGRGGQRVRVWLKSLPGKLTDKPLLRLWHYWKSDKGNWTYRQTTLTMIVMIPLMNLISGIGVFASILPFEGFAGPSWTILRAYLASQGLPLF